MKTKSKQVIISICIARRFCGFTYFKALLFHLFILRYIVFYYKREQNIYQIFKKFTYTHETFDFCDIEFLSHTPNGIIFPEKQNVVKSEYYFLAFGLVLNFCPESVLYCSNRITNCVLSFYDTIAIKMSFR